MNLFYVLISIQVILGAGIICTYLSKPTAWAERDELIKDGIKSVMLEENRIILKGTMPRTIPQTYEQWDKYRQFLANNGD